MRSVGFLQFICKQYAQASISEKTDRDVAISSLMKRIERVWDTECKYGIFANHFSRLLLWRRRNDVKGVSYKDQQLPSWSWMTYSHIEFHELEMFSVLRKESLQFDSRVPNALAVKLRAVESCRVQGDGVEAIIIDSNDKKAGKCWFDTESEARLDKCVVLALDTKSDDGSNSERMCHILLVSKRTEGEHYERIGVAQIRARCLSKEQHEECLL